MKAEMQIMMTESLATKAAATPVIPSVELLKKELAARVKVTVRTIENWQQLGIIDFVRVGKIVRFDWAEVVEQLKAKFRVSRKADIEGGGRSGQ